MPPTGKQDDGGTMPVLPRTVLHADFAFDPGKISTTGFLSEKLLIIMNQFCDDAAAGNIILIHENKPSSRLQTRQTGRRPSGFLSRKVNSAT